MPYEIKYDRETDRDKAIQDAKDYIGDRWPRVYGILKDLAKSGTGEILVFGLSLQGVEGYPAEMIVEALLEGREI